MSYIRPIAICLFQRGDTILVSEEFDHTKGSSFCRPLGGGIEFGETSVQAIRREVREEIGAEVTNLRLLGTLENIFTCLGRPGHEIVQVYDGEFVDASLYHAGSVAGKESDGQLIEAVWRPTGSFDEGSRLVPEGLLDLLQRGAHP